MPLEVPLLWPVLATRSCGPFDARRWLRAAPAWGVLLLWFVLAPVLTRAEPRLDPTAEPAAQAEPTTESPPALATQPEDALSRQAAWWDAHPLPVLPQDFITCEADLRLCISAEAVEGREQRGQLLLEGRVRGWIVAQDLHFAAPSALLERAAEENAWQDLFLRRGVQLWRSGSWLQAGEAHLQEARVVLEKRVILRQERLWLRGLRGVMTETRYLLRGTAQQPVQMRLGEAPELSPSSPAAALPREWKGEAVTIRFDVETDTVILEGGTRLEALHEPWSLEAASLSLLLVEATPPTEDNPIDGTPTDGTPANTPTDVVLPPSAVASEPPRDPSANEDPREDNSQEDIPQEDVSQEGRLPRNRTLRELSAHGDVRVRDGQRRLRADRLFSTGELTEFILSGRAEVIDGETSVLRAPRIVYRKEGDLQHAEGRPGALAFSARPRPAATNAPAAAYVLSDAALQKLADDGLPPRIVLALTPLIGQVHPNQERFAAALRQRLSTTEQDLHLASILDAARP